MSAADFGIEDGTARLCGDLTFSTVTRLHERMEKLSRKNGMPRRIDLADVGKIDSAGLALLLEWQSRFRKQPGKGDDESGQIEIANPPDALLKIARLCDAEQHLSATGPDRPRDSEHA